jgi:excisionase family DNA binding protein
MQELLSPKQVATSIGVSESSLKRWCDQGLITTEKTPGGHRRIHIRDVVRFLRQQDHPLVHPEALRLPTGAGRLAGAPADSRDSLITALETGDNASSRRLVIEHYLSGSSLLEICEQLLTPTLHMIGERWECGRTEVYQEHRACEALNRVLFELRGFLPLPGPDAPLAMGGTPPGDNYRLATLMVELILAEEGWNAVSLGSSLPLATLAAAARHHQPQLFWFSVSHTEDVDELVRGFDAFLAETPPTMQVVVGGRESQDLVAATLGRGASSGRLLTGGNLTTLRDTARRIRLSRSA